MRLAKTFLICLLLLGLGPHAGAIESGPERVALLELFSSEGCSSCPPADRWVSGLRGDPGLWKDFVPVVFHVHYWDRLGWKDRFASSTFTRRQERYARNGGGGSIYTPGFFLNGREWTNWRYSQSIPAQKSDSPGTLRVHRKGPDAYDIVFDPSGSYRWVSSWKVHVALLGFGITSNVRAGENSGRKLSHDFIVLAYEEKVMDLDQGKGVILLKISASPSLDAQPEAIAVWVSNENESEPIQAAGGYL